MQTIASKKITQTSALSAGLTEEQARVSREANGSNKLSAAHRRSFLAHFIGNLGDPVIRILLFALGVNLIFVFRGGDVIETVGIAISVFLATLISTLSERGSEAAFRRLSEECSRASFRVRRDGRLREIPIEDIVVGDVIMLGAGEQAPADGFLISGSLSVDQSSMTGENKEIKKRVSGDRRPLPEGESCVLRGCPILGGEGEIEVFAVGDATFLGKISQEVQMQTRQSPLKLRLSKLARQISVLGYFAAALIALAYLFNTFVSDSGWETELILMKLRDVPYLLEHLLHALMLGLTVIVVAVPDG